MISLKHDFAIDLADAPTRKSKRWSNKKWKWSEVLERCRETLRTAETAEEYSGMTKERQSDIKDVGGFVAGYLAGGTRRKTGVLYKSAATLDIDNGRTSVWEDFKREFGCAAMLYSTHKHSPKNPRFRLVIPFSDTVNPEDYEPVCRKIAEKLGMELFDPSTYELSRMFYWPSTSRDADYVFEYQDGPACDAARILSEYENPKDARTWPVSEREGEAVAHEMRKAGDPLEKPGMIGAFCRAYTIEDALAEFLKKEYEPTDTPGRYTYRQGSTAGGLVCWHEKFAYSHHATDPAGGRLLNAFDICRIHLYGDRDENSRTEDITRLPSYTAMQDKARGDKKVKMLLARERRASAEEDFGSVSTEAGRKPENPDGRDWEALLEYNRKGDPLRTTPNVKLIYRNDPEIAGRVLFDDFSEHKKVADRLPWRKEGDLSDWTDGDDACLRCWLEEKHKIRAKDISDDAFKAMLMANRFHPVRDYLNGLEWDGVPRLDRLIINYLGAEDSELNRAMTRKHFTAAVARVFEPGCKYDTCLTLTGPEGTGKSTLPRIMGGEWYNDSIPTIEGTRGMEQLRGSWLVEFSELGTLNKSEVETVKMFLSKTSDRFRAAYARNEVERPRQCVFFGSTNEVGFLKGNNGNRRFWVIPVRPELKAFRDGDEALAALTADRDQLWAEAVRRYRDGEKLVLDKDLEKLARERQKEYNEDRDDPLPGQLEAYLGMLLPVDWDSYSQADRAIYTTSYDGLKAEGVVKRDLFSPVEFIWEALKVNTSNPRYKSLALKVNALMRENSGWEDAGRTRHAKPYGRQRSFKRKERPAEDIL